MKQRAWIASCFFLLLSVPAIADSAEDLKQAVDAYQEHRLKDALGAFLKALSLDTRNVQAHMYLNLITKEIETQRNASVKDARLQVMRQAAQHLEDDRVDTKALRTAIQDTTQAEQHAQQMRWQAWCEEASMEMALNHLFAAHDRTLKVLAENPSHAEAQQIMSQLQSRIYMLIKNNTFDSTEERFALEGFYAFGQADYEAAATAWEKGATFLQQTYPATEAARHLSALRYEPYLKIAQAHVDEDKARAQVQVWFQQGSDLYQHGHFVEALQSFRQAAILNPEYPQLGFCLAEAEAAVEKDRARRLGEEKRKKVAQLFEEGVAALAHDRYAAAARALREALDLDPTHPQARADLILAESEIQRRHDPLAAQQHYEAGLIAYASGRLEDALREWRITVAMDPQHQKASNALAKVQKELAFSKGGNLLDPALPADSLAQ